MFLYGLTADKVPARDKETDHCVHVRGEDELRARAAAACTAANLEKKQGVKERTKGSGQKDFVFPEVRASVDSGGKNHHDSKHVQTHRRNQSSRANRSFPVSHGEIHSGQQC